MIPIPAAITGELVRRQCPWPDPTESELALEQDPQAIGCRLKSEKHLKRCNADFKLFKKVYVRGHRLEGDLEKLTQFEGRYSLPPTQSACPTVERSRAAVRELTLSWALLYSSLERVP